MARCAAVFVVLFSCGTIAVGADQDEPSLKKLLEDAKRHAQSVDQREQAITEYRALVEIHLANEARFQAALGELMACYEVAGKPAEGFRYLLDTAYKMEPRGRHERIQELVGQFRLKHPEEFRKIAEEMKAAAGPKARVADAAVPTSALVEAIQQRKDPSLRDKSLDHLRKLLASESSTAEKRAGLATLRAALTAKFDRGSFRSLVLPLLKSEDDKVREMALSCLPALDATPDDLAHVIPLADDASPAVRAAVGGALIAIGKGDHADTVIPALAKLLEDSESDVVTATIRSMWGQYFSPEFDALLIELSRDPKYHGIIVYHALSTMRTKSLPVCQRLIEVLDEPDWNDSGRAAWGLTYGVTDEAKPAVEDGLLAALPEEANQYTRDQEFRALRGVATEKSRAYLTSVAGSEMETEKTREAAQQILNDLDGKR
ncbi:MAG: HEAT repeat domain-containing protein [Pirellulales bacterium]|nr:HEAT repeat domain-containing protein [Pirellulales bacterium]